MALALVTHHSQSALSQTSSSASKAELCCLGRRVSSVDATDRKNVPSRAKWEPAREGTRFKRVPKVSRAQSRVAKVSRAQSRSTMTKHESEKQHNAMQADRTERQRQTCRVKAISATDIWGDSSSDQEKDA
eukprot:6174049-Pleurochrysis_carterae.AAC.6